MLLWRLRGVPSDAWVRDHPSKMGSLVLDHPASEVPPKLDFDLSENGPAENNPGESSPGESKDSESGSNSWIG